MVVVDDESTDGTAALCRARGAKVFSHKLEGFGSQKQYALERCSGDWALSIDADERVTPELARENTNPPSVHQKLRKVSAGYCISRHMYFLFGKRLSASGASGRIG